MRMISLLRYENDITRFNKEWSIAVEFFMCIFVMKCLMSQYF